jgi:hypothetical protein
MFDTILEAVNALPKKNQPITDNSGGGVALLVGFSILFVAVMLIAIFSIAKK